VEVNRDLRMDGVMGQRYVVIVVLKALYSEVA